MNSMNHSILILTTALMVLINVGCNKEEEVTLESIMLTAEATQLAAGHSTTLTATGQFSDSTIGPVDVNWTSSDSGIAQVYATATDKSVAILSTYGQGSATITAEASDGSGVSASMSITVAEPVLMSLTVSPTTATVAMGMTRTYLAAGTYSDGSTSAATVDWTVDDTNLAAVDATGVVTALAEGTALVTATSTDRPEIFATASMIVVGAVPVSLSVTPDPASVDAGNTLAFTATASMSDGSTTTPPVVWTSSDHNTASVDSSGVATGVTAGTATLTATSTDDSTLTGSATLTVNAPVLVSLSIHPDPASVMVLQTIALTATGHYSDNSTATETVTWASDDTNMASVDGSGTATGLAVGTANITATAVSDTTITATVSLTVRPPFDYLYLNCAYYTSGVGILRVPYAGGQAQTFSTARRFNTNGMCLSPDKSKMYLLDRTGSIDEIDMSTGNMTRIYTNQSYNAGQSFVSLSCDPQGMLYTFYANGGNVVYQIDPVNRTRTNFCSLNGQMALFDSHFYQGELYVCFWGGVAKAGPGGTLTNIYNGSVITSIDMDPQGNFVVVDNWNKKVLKMRDTDNNGFILSNEVSTLADFSTANVFGISECMVDALGQVYIAEVPGGSTPAQGIWRLTDNNNDGDCLDAGEMGIWTSTILTAASGGGNMAMK